MLNINDKMEGLGLNFVKLDDTFKNFQNLFFFFFKELSKSLIPTCINHELHSRLCVEQFTPNCTL